LNRKGIRSRVNLFQGKGINPAMGFASNVLDLGRFAAWQFRLLDSNQHEVLNSATLKYMQQVHWTDPDFKTTWGLGFVVYKGSDGSKWISHGGSCPGYRSVLMLNPKQKLAYTVIINASGTDPGKYARGMREILTKVEEPKKSDKPKDKEIQWADYIGYYDPSPWWSEEYIGTLNGKLVSMRLPAEKPSITYYKHMEGDTFRRIRNDDELGEELIFERNAAGEVIHYHQHGNKTFRIR